MYHKIMGYRKSMLVILAFILLYLFREYSLNRLSVEVTLIVSLSTFVYGFFMNSMFKFIDRKYNLFKLNMAEISAHLQSLYEMSLISSSKKYSDELKRVILIFVNGLKSSDPKKVHHLQDMIGELFLVMKYFKVKNKLDNNCQSRSLQLMYRIGVNRERIEVYGHQYLVGQMKFLFYSFPIFISLMILFNSWNNVGSFVMGCILIILLTFNTALIHDVDSLGYGSYTINVANLEQLEKSINKQAKSS